MKSTGKLLAEESVPSRGKETSTLKKASIPQASFPADFKRQHQGQKTHSQVSESWLHLNSDGRPVHAVSGIDQIMYAPGKTKTASPPNVRLALEPTSNVNILPFGPDEPCLNNNGTPP